MISGIKWRDMRWTGHIVCVEREEVHTGFWWRNPMQRDRLEDPCADARIVLKEIIEKYE
jgi:hypothetical protein